MFPVKVKNEASFPTHLSLQSFAILATGERVSSFVLEKQLCDLVPNMGPGYYVAEQVDLCFVEAFTGFEPWHFEPINLVSPDSISYIPYLFNMHHWALKTTFRSYLPYDCRSRRVSMFPVGSGHFELAFGEHGDPDWVHPNRHFGVNDLGLEDLQSQLNAALSDDERATVLSQSLFGACQAGPKESSMFFRPATVSFHLSCHIDQDHAQFRFGKAFFERLFLVRQAFESGFLFLTSQPASGDVWKLFQYVFFTLVLCFGEMRYKVEFNYYPLA